MGFIANLFRKASDIAFLERQVLLIESERDKYKLLNDANAKQVIAERNKRDKDNVRFNQTLTKLAGGNPNVFNEPKELAEPQPEPLSEKQREGVRALALQMLADDENNGDTPLQVEEYESLILAKSEEYLPLIIVE